MNYGKPVKEDHHQLLADLWAKLIALEKIDVNEYWDLIEPKLSKHSVQTKGTLLFYARLNPAINLELEAGRITAFCLCNQYKDYPPELNKLELNKPYNVKMIHDRLQQVYPKFIGLESFSNWIHSDYQDRFVIEIDKIKRID